MAIRKTDPRGVHVLHDVRGEVQDFLDGMAHALRAGDGAGIAAMYELPALIISDDGVTAVESPAQVVRLFGVVHTRADLIDLERIGKRIVVATVRWPDLDVDYTLRRDDEGRLRIRSVLMRGMAAQPNR